MARVDCPNGSEPQTGVDLTFITNEEWLLGLFAWLPPQVIGALIVLFGVSHDIVALCGSPPVEYPTFENGDLLDFSLLVSKLEQYILADLWDENCQCKTAPAG